MSRQPILLLLLASLGAPYGATAVTLGGCSHAGGALDLAVNPTTGSVVTVGMERIGVFEGGLGNGDFRRIDLPYGGDALTAPEGDRFAIRQGKTVYLYDFTSFKRIGKKSFKALKDESIRAYRWQPGGDEILIVGEVVKSSMFDLKTTRQPNLVRINLASGEGARVSLSLDGDLRTAAFDPAGERVALGFADGNIEIRSSRDGALLTRYQVHEPSDWGSIGLSFHPRRNVVVSAGANKLVYYDLDAGQAESVHSGIQGGPFLRLVAGGQYLVLGNQSALSFADPNGRAIETRTPSSEHYYGEIRLAEPLQKVFSLGSELVCWHTFRQWQKIAASAAAGAASAQALEQLRSGAEVTYKGQPLGVYIDRLDDPDFNTRIEAFQDLESIGPAAAAAVPALIRVLRGDEPARQAGEPSLARFAMAALGAMGEAAEPAVPLLGKALGDENADRRRAAVQCLVKLGPVAEAAVQALTRTIRDPVIDIRMAAVQALGEIGPGAESAVPALQALSREDPRIKGLAADAIEKIEKGS